MGNETYPFFQDQSKFLIPPPIVRHNVRIVKQIETICQINSVLERSAGWKHTSLKDICFGLCCEVSYPLLYLNPSVDSIDTLIMRNCHHNDVVGLKNRYLKETNNHFVADVNVIDRILDELADLLRPNFNGPLSLREFVECKKGALRKRYNDAATSVLTNGFDLRHHSKISAFIKNEVYNELKPPRMIMGRDPRFNLIYGLYTTALEHAMQFLPEVSKGRNFIGRGQQFFDKIFGADILEVDFSKYEATQRLKLLRIVEIGLWRRLIPSHLQYLEQLFIAKMRKKGRTLNNVEFEFYACRGSGDMDTGLFNTLLTWVSCRYFEIVNRSGNFNFMCDGDDNLMRIPIGLKYRNTFADFGFDAKIIHRTDYHDVDYCSGKFVQSKPGNFIYVQNLNKLMASLPVFRKLKFSHCKGTYYYSLGFMYKRLYGRFPVYSAIAQFLMSFSPNRKVSTEILEAINPSHCLAFKNSSVDLIDIDEEQCLVELAMCFNHPVSELKRLHSWYEEHTVTLQPDEDRRYNPSKTPATVLSAVQLDTVESILYSSVLSYVPNQKLQRVLAREDLDT